MNQTDLSPLRKNFSSTGAKDDLYFWIHGASNFIPNMVKFIERINIPNIVNISENEKSTIMKDMIIKHGSDKHFHNYQSLIPNYG